MTPSQEAQKERAMREAEHHNQHSSVDKSRQKLHLYDRGGEENYPALESSLKSNDRMPMAGGQEGKEYGKTLYET